MDSEEQPTRCDWCRKVVSDLALDRHAMPGRDGASEVVIHSGCFEAWKLNYSRHPPTWERLAELVGLAGATAFAGNPLDRLAWLLREEAKRHE